MNGRMGGGIAAHSYATGGDEKHEFFYLVLSECKENMQKYILNSDVEQCKASIHN